jgi:hypothetical protein
VSLLGSAGEEQGASRDLHNNQQHDDVTEAAAVVHAVNAASLGSYTAGVEQNQQSMHAVRRLCCTQLKPTAKQGLHVTRTGAPTSHMAQ